MMTMYDSFGMRSVLDDESSSGWALLLVSLVVVTKSPSKNDSSFPFFCNSVQCTGSVVSTLEL